MKVSKRILSIISINIFYILILFQVMISGQVFAGTEEAANVVTNPVRAAQEGVLGGVERVVGLPGGHPLVVLGAAAVMQPPYPVMERAPAGLAISDAKHLKNIGYACACGGCVYSKQLRNSEVCMTRCVGTCCCPCIFAIGALTSCTCAPVWAASTECTDQQRRWELDRITAGRPRTPILAEFLVFGLCTDLRFY